MKKFGEFFDAVEKWAKDSRAYEAKSYLEEWKGLVSSDRWREVQQMDFTKDLFASFAQDMASYFRERIQHICTDALYDSTMRRGQVFLKAIADIGRQFGLKVEDVDVDVPLSLAAALGRTQLS